MIVWINGAFGSGKTTVAYELQRRVKNSFVYDPENVGYFLWKNEPEAMKKENFQQEPLWREFNQKMLYEISTHYEGVVLVPMSLTEPQYYGEIIGALRKKDILVKHCVLGAKEETILKRLRSRSEGKKSWAAQQAAKCVQDLKNPVFENYIITDFMTVSQMVDVVAARTGLELMDENKSRLIKWILRKKVQLKHIRF